MAKRISKEHGRILEEYQALLNSIRSSAPIDTTETLKDQLARKKCLLEDYAAFSKYYFPMWCKGEAASFHINFANELATRDVCFLIKMWARGLSKSTTSWMAVLWLLVRGDFKFLVLVSYNNDNATALLENIRAQLEANPRLIHDFGEFMRYGKWNAGNFQTKQGHSFRSIGRGQTPRGFNDNGQRPDLIIIDDIDDDETSRNPKRVEEGYKWVMGALFGTFDTAGKKRLVFLENLSNNNSILKLAAENKRSEVEQINLLDEQGEPSWKEHHTKEQCEIMIDTMGYREAQAEYFNNPITEGKIYKKAWFPYKEALELNLYDDMIVYTDPSWKSEKKNDCKATVIVAMTGLEYHILFVRVDQTTIGQMAQWQTEANDYVNGQFTPTFLMEGNFMQDRLVDDTQNKLEEAQVPLFIKTDTRKKPEKLTRLQAMSVAFEKGRFFLAEHLRGCSHTERMIIQFLALEKGSKVADDAPDAVEGAYYWLNQRKRRIDQPVVISINELKSKRTKFKY